MSERASERKKTRKRKNEHERIKLQRGIDRIGFCEFVHILYYYKKRYVIYKIYLFICIF